MNLKNVLKTYSLLRQLSDDETALLNTLREMNDAERELLVESLQPEKSAKPERNQQARCTHIYSSGLVCNGVARNTVHHNTNHLDFHQFTTEKQKKSKHAQSLEGAVRRTPKLKVDDDDDGFCAACHVQIGHNVHHLESLPDYHPFQSKSDAQSAAAQSSANGAEQSATQNSGTQDASVGV